MELKQKLELLEQLSGTYCVGKVQGEINTPVRGSGDYYAFAKGTSYLADSIDDAVEEAIENLKVKAA